MMRVCPHCERLTTQSSVLCERCLRGPASVGDWHANRTYQVQGWGIATVILVVLATLYFGAMNTFVPVFAFTAAADPETREVAYAFTTLEMWQSLSALLILVPLSLWMWRAVKNTEAFPTPLGGLQARWAIWGWFVPVLNFSYPQRVMLQLAREEREGNAYGNLVRVWWLAVSGAVLINLAELFGLLGTLPPAMAATGSLTADPTEAHQAFFDTRFLSGLATSVCILIAGVTLCSLILAIGSAQAKRVAARATRQQYHAAAAAAPASQQPAELVAS